jgi:hypothetical protein
MRQCGRVESYESEQEKLYDVCTRHRQRCALISLDTVRGVRLDNAALRGRGLSGVSRGVVVGMVHIARIFNEKGIFTPDLVECVVRLMSRSHPLS